MILIVLCASKHQNLVEFIEFEGVSDEKEKYTRNTHSRAIDRVIKTNQFG